MKLIVAVDEKFGIGKNNDLLFSLPTDMKFFREKTLNKIVVMGYNTLLSFPNSKPLKNRINIVFTRKNIKRDDCIIVHSIEELKVELANYNSEQVFVIGGAMIYKMLYPYCDEAYITKIYADGEAEVFFDNLDLLDNWSQEDVSEVLNDNGINFQFKLYKNSAPKSL